MQKTYKYKAILVSEREMEDKKFHNENDIWAYLEPDENLNNHINKMRTLDGKCFEIFKIQYIELIL